MAGNLLFGILNPVLSLVFAGAFLLLWRHQPHNRSLLGFAASFSLVGLGFALQYLNPPIGLTVIKFLSNLSFVAGSAVLAGTALARYGLRVPYLALAVIGTAGMVACLWFLVVSPYLPGRVLATNLAVGAIALVFVLGLARLPNKRPLDLLLTVLVAIVSVNLVQRAAFTMLGDGSTFDDDAFYQSTYWLSTLVSHAIFSTICAITLILITTFDAFAEAKRESHTDLLSGLLNRRGFVAKAEAVLADTPAAGGAILIVADLDRFKSVNDRFGHAAGDAVITRFGTLLEEAADRLGVAGRLGGEEFALLIPGHGIAIGTMFAEGLRVTIAAERFADKEGLAVTASFGLAERRPGESLSSVLTRADAALYAAKRDGRNRVSIHDGGHDEGEEDTQRLASASTVAA